MFNNIKEALDKYFDTLKMIGNINHNETSILIIMTFIRRFIRSRKVIFTQEDINKLNEILDCLTSKSCTLKPISQLCLGTISNPSSIITQNGIPISGQNRIIISSQTGETQMFPDFEFRTDLQSDNFLVGYDTSDQVETRYSIGDIGLFWEVDL